MLDDMEKLIYRAEWNDLTMLKSPVHNDHSAHPVPPTSSAKNVRRLKIAINVIFNAASKRLFNVTASLPLGNSIPG